MSKRTRLLLDLAAQQQSSDDETSDKKTIKTTTLDGFVLTRSYSPPLEVFYEETPILSIPSPPNPNQFVPIESSCIVTGDEVFYGSPPLQQQCSSNCNELLENQSVNNDQTADIEAIKTTQQCQGKKSSERKTLLEENEDANNVRKTPFYDKSDSDDNVPLSKFVQGTTSLKASHAKGYKKNGDPRKRRKKRTSEELKITKERKEKDLAEKHKVLPPCQISICRKRCTSNISENQRKNINCSFWNLTYQERKNFILNSCSRLEVQKRRNPDNQYRKKNTFKYYFKNDKGESIEVCKVFFLTTLGFQRSNDRLLHNTLSKTPKNKLRALIDQRGRASNKHKIDYNVVDDHIETFHPSISHYRREHAPNRRYLPSDVTVSFMYEDFKTKYPNIKISYDAYRVHVKQKNISFCKLGHEECETCEEFKLHGHKEDNFQDDCGVCCKWKKHIELAKDSRKLYREQAEMNDENVVRVSVDLQKVIMLPRIDCFKRVIFSKRLIAYHESFVCLGSSTAKLSPFAVLWNESISGRNKEDIVSTFYAFLLWKRDTKSFVFWLDNCASQNKNWCFLTFLVRMVNSDEIAVNEISINYFEPGHSFMAADSFHHQVELSLKKQGKTYDFEDFVSAVRNVKLKNKVEVKTMNYTDFYLWKDLKSQQKLKQDRNRPLLSNIRQLKATRGYFVLKYKNSFRPDEDFKTLDFLCKKVMKKSVLLSPVSSLSNPSGFPKSKKDALLNLLGDIIPESRKNFWKNLPECDD